MSKKLIRVWFSLVELLVVIAIIGILVSVALPMMNVSELDAKNCVRDKEMHDIQAAFMAFYNDCCPTDIELDEVRRYGLWPLLQPEHPITGVTPWGANYDSQKGKGWRGPYIITEKFIKVDSASLSFSPGQKDSDYDVGPESIPVLLSPFKQHYRVLVPTTSGIYDYARITLVAPGAGDTDSLDSDDLVAAKGDEIKAKGNDKILRLLPFRN